MDRDDPDRDQKVQVRREGGQQAAAAQAAGGCVPVAGGRLSAVPPGPLHLLCAPRQPGSSQRNQRSQLRQRGTHHQEQAAEPALPGPPRRARPQVVRNGINGWVARYRRDQKFAGKPSYA
jgi:hypothetical protein